MIQHITSVIWTESHETSNMIGHFVKVFSKHDQYTKSGIFPFNYVTKYDTTRRIFIVRQTFSPGCSHKPGLKIFSAISHLFPPSFPALSFLRELLVPDVVTNESTRHR